MITSQDKIQLNGKGISEEQLENQLQRFRTGFPYLKLYAAASPEKGIYVPTEDERNELVNRWDAYRADGEARIVKFVPASGAASRMFKNLFAFINADYNEPKTDFERKFFDNLQHFAFFGKLCEECLRIYSLDATALVKAGNYKAVVKTLLEDNGLGYGSKPKGLLLFHSYPDGARTPLEEHLYEGSLIAADADGNVRIHFTVSHEHRNLFEKHVAEAVPAMEKALGVRFDVTFSEQKPETDTVAVTPNNELFRNDDGSLLFRPGGHGALIENLNEIDADVIFIKNIDNIVPERLMPGTVVYKKLLAGKLVELQERIFEYLEELDGGLPDDDRLGEMLQFLEQELWCIRPGGGELSGPELADYLFCKFNRPLRVCGMVRNVGEAGGGPFLAYNADGTVSPQILESSQINLDDETNRRMFENGTHFNPVDIVCATKDYMGRKFDLRQYVDPSTGFISHKSKNGRELKALELPGLWNGAMSDWNTVFVEVPLLTFNPVKTVNDLLRLQHQ